MVASSSQETNNCARSHSHLQAIQICQLTSRVCLSIVGVSLSTQREPTATQGEHATPHKNKKIPACRGVRTQNLPAVRRQCQHYRAALKPLYVEVKLKVSASKLSVIIPHRKPLCCTATANTKRSVQAKTGSVDGCLQDTVWVIVLVFNFVFPSK